MSRSNLTPEAQHELMTSTAPAIELADRFGVHEQTVYYWRRKGKGQRKAARAFASAKVDSSLPVLQSGDAVQRCERLNARLRVVTCAERSRRADVAKKPDEERSPHNPYACCRDCSIGQEHRRIADMRAAIDVELSPDEHERHLLAGGHALGDA